MKKRPKRKIRLIVALLPLLFASGARAQSSFKTTEFLSGIRGSSGLNRACFSTGSIPGKDKYFFPEITGPSSSIWARKQGPGTVPVKISLYVPADFYARQLGFFCKKEWKLEQAVHVPFRFRLGSLDYCNYLEGKNSSDHLH